MNLEKYLVIAGVPGIHKLVASRGNGLIIEDKKEGRTRFVPVRQHQVTPIATVAVYTETEEGTIPLTEVFQKMLDQREATPPPSPDSSSTVLREYFTTVLPEHDKDQVHINDIKKCIKWFNFMLEKGIFEEAQREAQAQEAVEAPAEQTAEAEPEQPTEPVAAKPAKKKKAEDA